MALTNYLEDDWNDNALSGRSNALKDVFYQYGTGGAGDLLKGVYRPVWTVQSGTPSATNGEIEFPSGGGQIVDSPSTFTVGKWQFDWHMNSGGSRAARPAIMALGSNYQSSTAPQNGYRLDIANTGNSTYDLYKENGGSSTSIIGSSGSNDTNTHTTKVTRDSYGNFELFEDGTSKGTTTDTTFATSEFLSLTNDMDAKMFYDNLVCN